MNNTGVLQIESQGNSIVIRDGADKIRRNRMAKLYMRSNLKFSDCGDHIQVEITENVNVTMNHIKVLAKYINCEISFGEGINREMQNFRTQESLFEEFSQQARNIRDNHPQIDEFKRFEESLIKTCRIDSYINCKCCRHTTWHSLKTLVIFLCLVQEKQV